MTIDKTLGLILLLIPVLAQATGLTAPQTREFTFDDQSTFRINIPSGWESAEGLFGVPLTLLGPEVGETRPTLVVQPTAQTGGLDPKDMKQNQADYQAGRDAWVKKQDGKVLQFLPYVFEKTKNLEMHRMGVKYQIAGTTFTEWSVHLFCHQKLYFLKALFEAKHSRADQDHALAAIRSIDCK